MNILLFKKAFVLFRNTSLSWPSNRIEKLEASEWLTTIKSNQKGKPVNFLERKISSFIIYILNQYASKKYKTYGNQNNLNWNFY